MQRDHIYHIWPRDLDFTLAFRAVEDFILKREMKWGENQYHRYSIGFNSYENAHPSSFDEFLTTLKQAGGFEWFNCTLPFLGPTASTGISFDIEYQARSIKFAINGSADDTVVAVHDFIRKEWRLSNPPIHKRQAGRIRNLQATIFLGKHFDLESQAPARIVRRFLELLRYDVREADEYRALPIPQKVQELIECQDIYVGLVTGKRDHSWLVAEAAFAQGKNRHVIMIVEEESGFNPTIQGHDYEQIRFPTNLVEKSFINLMQEFRSLGISGL